MVLSLVVLNMIGDAATFALASLDSESEARQRRRTCTWTPSTMASSWIGRSSGTSFWTCWAWAAAAEPDSACFFFLCVGVCFLSENIVEWLEM